MQENEKRLLKSFGTWLLKIAFQLSILVSLFLLLHLRDFDQKGAFAANSQRLDASINEISHFGASFARLGWQPLAVLAITSLFFLIFWIKNDPGWYEHLPSVIRDLVVIYIFTAFSGLYYQNNSTFLNTASAISIYLVIAVANFGGLLEDKKDAIRDILQVAVILLVGNGISWLTGHTAVNFYAGYFIDLAMIYIIGFILKLFFFPQSMLTFDIDEGKPQFLEVRRLGFALLSIFVFFPLAALFFAGIFQGLFWLVGHFLPFAHLTTTAGDNTVNIRSLFSAASLSGFYLMTLLKKPIALVSFFVALLAHLRSYAFHFLDDTRAGDILPAGEYKNPLLRQIGSFPLPGTAAISWPFLLVSLLSLLLNTVLLSMFFSGKDILEPLISFLCW